MEKRNKKRSTKDIATGIIFENLLLNQTEQQLRETITQEGLNPDTLLAHYKKEIEQIRTHIEGKKKKAKFDEKFRPKL